MTNFIKKIKSTMNLSTIFSQAHVKAPVNSIQNITKVNGMGSFAYPSSIYTLK